MDIRNLANECTAAHILRAIGYRGTNASMIPVLPQGCCIICGATTTYPVRAWVDPLELEKQPMSSDRDFAKDWGVE